MAKLSVLITGCSSGLGNAVVNLLCQSDSYEVIGADMNDSQSDFDNFTFIKADLSNRDSVDSLISKVKLHCNDNLYSVINVAGVSIGKSIIGMEVEDWDQMIQVNLTSPAQLISSLQSIIPDGGRIVNVGSPVSITGSKKPGYAASKAGIHGLTMSVAKNLGPRNILVNTIFPGPMITGMTRKWSDDKRESIATESFLDRLTTPEEVANGIKFLLDPATSGITGSILDYTAGSMFTH
jgi:NAD(P)-dependent dehydrogenase (short-subunit alcohol dehydrogenase family)